MLIIIGLLLTLLQAMRTWGGDNTTNKMTRGDEAKVWLATAGMSIIAPTQLC